MPISTSVKIIELDYETARRKARLAKQQRNIYDKCPSWAVYAIWSAVFVVTGIWGRILWITVKQAAYAVSMRFAQ